MRFHRCHHGSRRSPLLPLDKSYVGKNSCTLEIVVELELMTNRILSPRLVLSEPAVDLFLEALSLLSGGNSILFNGCSFSENGNEISWQCREWGTMSCDCGIDNADGKWMQVNLASDRAFQGFIEFHLCFCPQSRNPFSAYCCCVMCSHNMCINIAICTILFCNRKSSHALRSDVARNSPYSIAVSTHYAQCSIWYSIVYLHSHIHSLNRAKSPVGKKNNCSARHFELGTSLQRHVDVLVHLTVYNSFALTV